MSKSGASIALPRLNLTAQDVDELRALTAALESELLSQYDDFVRARNRKVDTAKWKYVKTEGNLAVHHERRAKDREFSPSTEPQAHLASKSSNRRMLLTGKVSGTVDDALYGSCFHDTASLRISEAYRREFLDDSAMVAMVDAPTDDDPFRFLGVTWHMRCSRLSIDRDAVLLRSTRLSTLSTGERIGLSIQHSISHRDLPTLHEFALTRISLSSVAVYRQLSVEYVEAFGIELMDEKRSLDAVQNQEAIRDLLKNASVCEGAIKKKLHWLMRCRHRKSRDSDDESALEADRQHCALCMKSTSGLFAVSGASCQLCTKHVCSRCTITHAVVIDASTAKVVAKPFGFCIECLLQTKKTPTIKIASAELESNLRNSSESDIQRAFLLS